MEQQYAIVFNPWRFDLVAKFDEIGLALKSKGAWYQTAISYRLAEAQRLRAELIERGLPAEELRIEYAT